MNVDGCRQMIEIGIVLVMHITFKNDICTFEYLFKTTIAH